MATQDHCNSKKIRPWILSSADESDRLPRQNREAPGRASHQSELEHDPKGRKNSGGRLTAENAEHTEWFLVFRCELCDLCGRTFASFREVARRGLIQDGRQKCAGWFVVQASTHQSHWLRN